MQVYQATGRPLATKKLTSTNTAQQLTTAYMGATATRITQSGLDRGAYACLLTCETNSVRVTYGNVDPTVDSGTALGHVLTAGSSMLLDCEEQVNSLRFISKVTDTAGVLQCTPFIADGR